MYHASTLPGPAGALAGGLAGSVGCSRAHQSRGGAGGGGRGRGGGAANGGGRRQGRPRLQWVGRQVAALLMLHLRQQASGGLGTHGIEPAVARHAAGPARVPCMHVAGGSGRAAWLLGEGQWGTTATGRTAVGVGSEVVGAVVSLGAWVAVFRTGVEPGVEAWVGAGVD